MRTVKNRSSAGISVVTRDRGNRTMKAPMTPEIAPLAPMVGTFEPEIEQRVDQRPSRLHRSSRR